jgi:4-amino-4-deoxy-L-arabinose transferase-like glycosyltransferase
VLAADASATADTIFTPAVSDTGSSPEPVPWTRRLQVWRSPPGQPAWARPGLLGVAALASLAYCWQVGATIEIYYAATVRSMSHSWHDFVFGAFDPAGTISVDKLPGALWVQALSVRLFGFHEWAIMLPQAVEGALTVLVLFHAVRRLAGPAAALIAAFVLAASPATMTLDRGNIPDTLMILLVVLAADSTVTLILTNRWRSAVMAAVWVALAFQAKMLEAWLFLPALGLAYLVAGRGTTGQRLGRIAVLGGTVLVVSLSYMTFVALTPASQRPYADGSSTNSIYHQVFAYNGFSRVGQRSSSPDELLGDTLGTALFTQAAPPPAWNRLLTASYGRDTGWLLPAAVISAFAIVVARRRAPRADPWRAGALLWGVWLIVLGIVFSVSTTMNSYYAGALSPAVAGLLGLGGALAWAHRGRQSVALLSAGTVLITVGYAAWLLPPQGTGLPSWLAPAVVVVGLAAVALLAWLAWQERSSGRAEATREGSGLGGPGEPSTRASSPFAITAAALGALALVLVPSVASASVVALRLGPFDTPFQPAVVTTFIRHAFAPQSPPPGLAKIESVRRGASYLMAAQTSAVAAPYIYATGQEVLPLGGFTGTQPSPTSATVRRLVAKSRFHLALVATPSASASAAFVATHCLRVPPTPGRPASPLAPMIKIYYCLP